MSKDKKSQAGGKDATGERSEAAENPPFSEVDAPDVESAGGSGGGAPEVEPPSGVVVASSDAADPSEVGDDGVEEGSASAVPDGDASSGPGDDEGVVAEGVDRGDLGDDGGDGGQGGGGDEGDEAAASSGPRRAGALSTGERLISVGAALGLLLVMLVLVSWRLSPPSPLGDQVDESVFSAARAEASLVKVFGEKPRPHPVGSRTSRAIRDRLLAEFEGLGLEVQIQRRHMCTSYGLCTPVENVVARLPAPRTGAGVVLTAHYDSVAAGPGVGDDAAAVGAILEIARIMAASPAPRNPVVFLITDGEEAGLLGAKFFDAHPWSHPEHVFLNAEARGTAGPSYLFETGERQQWFVGHAASALERPMLSSLYATIYEILPNNTDFTVHRHDGHDGANFGFIQNLSHYHTPLDNLDNLDRGSLQHHGDNLLSLARRLSQADLSDRVEGKAVYFDVLSAVVVAWPVGVGVGLGGLAALLAALGLALAWRRSGGPRSVLGLMLPPLALMAALLVCGFVHGLIGWLTDHPAPWWGMRGPSVGLYWCLTLATSTGVLFGLGRKVGFWAAWAGVWAWGGALALLVSLVLPGASYLFVVPTLGVAVGIPALIGDARLDQAAWRWAAGLAPAWLGMLVWLPLTLALPDAVGLFSSMIVALPVTMIVLPLFAPLAEAGMAPQRFQVTVVALVAGVFCACAALIIPPATTWNPHGVNIVSVQRAHDNETLWHSIQLSPMTITGRRPPMPSAFADLVEPVDDAQPYPWFGPHEAYAVSECIPRLPPKVEALGRDGEGRQRFRLKSQRRASAFVVTTPPGVRLHNIEFFAATEPFEPSGGVLFGDHTAHLISGLPRDGLVIGVEAEQAGTMHVYDLTWGVADDAVNLIKARGDVAVPHQFGDVVLVETTVALGL